MSSYGCELTLYLQGGLDADAGAEPRVLPRPRGGRRRRLVGRGPRVDARLAVRPALPAKKKEHQEWD